MTPARELADRVARAAGDADVAVIHYGSHARGEDAGAARAHDFLLIVTDYLRAYELVDEPLGRAFGWRLHMVLVVTIAIIGAASLWTAIHRLARVGRELKAKGMG